MAKIGYGRTREEILDIVKSLLNKHPRPNPFVDNRPGRQWWNGFLRRHPNLTLRKPENLSKCRAVSCSKEAIFKWFRDLRTFINEELNCSDLLEDPARLYNADEAGFPISPTSDTKVLAELGSKDVYMVTSSDRSQITVLACGSAAGALIPPMMIFPGERFKYNPLQNGVPNTYLARTKNGWIDSEVFYMWIANHFVKHIPPARPVLLLVDGHSTHLDRNTTEFCKVNGIVLYCLPAHASHIVQPLDVAFFRPLKRNWKKSVKKYRDENPGQCLTKMIFSSVFRPAWEASNRPESLISGFRDSGLYPFNPEAIDARKFAPSLVYVSPLPPTTPDTVKAHSQPANESPVALVPAATASTHIHIASSAVNLDGVTTTVATAPASLIPHVVPVAVTTAAATPPALVAAAVVSAAVTPAVAIAVTSAASAFETPTAATPPAKPAVALAIATSAVAISPAKFAQRQPSDVTPDQLIDQIQMTTSNVAPRHAVTTGDSVSQSVPSSQNIATAASVYVSKSPFVTPLSTPNEKVYMGHKISPVLEGIITYPSVVKSNKKRRNDMPKALTGKQMEYYLKCKTEEKNEKEQKKLENKQKRKVKVEKSAVKTKKVKSEKKVTCKVCGRMYDSKVWYEWVGCDGVCDGWFCLKCTDISIDVENKDPKQIASEISDTQWFCSACLK